MSLARLSKALLHKLPAEVAHDLVIKSIAAGLSPKYKIEPAQNLQTSFMGIKLPHPVGLAAGFDKNAECINGLTALGFSFIEVGTSTPKPQAGNAKPRIFRLKKDAAIINRLGFNNKGLDRFAKNLSHANNRANSSAVIGANIGKNKDTENAIDDYNTMLDGIYDKADYITINISSPNTKGLRDIQNQDQINAFLSAINSRRSELAKKHNSHKPIALKIAPDLSEQDLETICAAVVANKIEGLIISNTTISRPDNLQSAKKTEVGGLSGKPLAQLSAQMLPMAKKLVGNKVDIVSVGGIFNADDVKKRLDNGACAVQIYTGFIYHGASLVKDIIFELNKKQ